MLMVFDDPSRQHMARLCDINNVLATVAVDPDGINSGVARVAVS